MEGERVLLSVVCVVVFAWMHVVFAWMHVVCACLRVVVREQSVRDLDGAGEEMNGPSWCARKGMAGTFGRYCGQWLIEELETNKKTHRVCK